MATSKESEPVAVLSVAPTDVSNDAGLAALAESLAAARVQGVQLTGPGGVIDSAR